MISGFGAGYPKIEVKLSTTNGSHALVFTQSSIKSDCEQPFVFPVEIAIEHSNGQWSSEELLIDQETTVLHWKDAGEPRQVIIDPNCLAVAEIEFDPGREMLLRSLRHSPVIHGRIHAAKSLIKAGLSTNLGLVHDAYKSEANPLFEPDRKGLSTAPQPEAGAVLRQMLATEEHAHVLAELANSCKSMPSQKMCESLKAFVARPNLPYRAKGNALISLGNLGSFVDDESWNILLNYSKDCGWTHFVRRQAIAAIGGLKTAKAAEQLRLILQSDDQSNKGLEACCLALGACARNLNDGERIKSKESLELALYNPSTKVIKAAITGLQRLNHPGAAAAIENSRHRLPVQEWPLIERAKNALIRSGKKSHGDLSKKIISLESELRELRHKLTV